MKTQYYAIMYDGDIQLLEKSKDDACNKADIVEKYRHKQCDVVRVKIALLAKVKRT